MWTATSEKLNQVTDSNEKVMCTFTIDKDTKDRFKQHSIRNGLKMNKLIENYMAQVCGL